MNKKSRRLSKLVSILNDLIDLQINEFNVFGIIEKNDTTKKIELLLQMINFELSYLQLKNYGTPK